MIAANVKKYGFWVLIIILIVVFIFFIKKNLKPKEKPAGEVEINEDGSHKWDVGDFKTITENGHETTITKINPSPPEILVELLQGPNYRFVIKNDMTMWSGEKRADIALAMAYGLQYFQGNAYIQWPRIQYRQQEYVLYQYDYIKNWNNPNPDIPLSRLLIIKASDFPPSTGNPPIEKAVKMVEINWQDRTVTTVK